MTNSSRVNQKAKASIRVQFRYAGFMDSVTGEWETDVFPGETEEQASNRANERALFIALNLRDMFLAKMKELDKEKEK